MSGSPTFDFQFVSSDEGVLAVLSQEARQNKDSEQVVVQNADGLERDNLTQRLTLDDHGSYRIKRGKLFEHSSPVTLVLDLRSMTASDIGRFNDLLDPEAPCIYDRQQGKKVPVGSHVHILILASQDQLPNRRTAQGRNNPGADFWRRINRPDNQWFSSVTATDSEAMETECQSVIPHASSAHDHRVTIDLHKSSDWRRTLYGGAGVDSDGKIKHIPGALEQLSPGQQVILKGANWSDLEFRQQIDRLNSSRTFEVNGQSCSLPEGVEFRQAPLEAGELTRMCQSVNIVDRAQNHQVTINQANLAQWFHPVSIAPSGAILPNEALESRILEGATLVIISPLTEAQWFVLLDHLQMIQQNNGHRASVFLASLQGQPEALLQSGLFPQPAERLAPLPAANPQDRTTGIVRYDSDAQIGAYVAQQPEDTLVLRVNASTGLNQLFDQLHVQSERTPRFGTQETELQKALRTGRRVVLLGLETNPVLQQHLETLLCNPASILAHGHWQSYPKGQLSVMWPDTVKPNSPLWAAAAEAGQKAMEVDIWAAAAQKHQLPEKAIPKEAIQTLYEAYSKVPKDIRQSVGELPPLTSGLLDNLIGASQQARWKDGAKELQSRHWRKALDSVLTHVTRRVPEVRDFMKVASRQLLPDEQGSLWVDPDQLTKKLQTLKKVDQRWVEKNFWFLARACGPGLLGSLELSFSSARRQKEALGTIHALLAVYAPKSLRQSIKLQLQPDPEQLKAFKQQLPPVRPSVRIKRLEDGLSSGWQLTQNDSGCRSQRIAELAASAWDISKRLNAESGREKLLSLLQDNLQWCGQGDAPWEQMVSDLLSGQTCQRDREQRRLSRLRERLADSPVVFIDGDTGTGKSYFSARMARMAGPAYIMTVGPSTEEKDILQGWTWENDDDNDRHMIQQKKILLEWAEARLPTSEGREPDNRYITLEVDEANLSRNGLMSTFRGLWDKPPCIYCDGHPIPVSDRHRVILTGNPADYAGRKIEHSLVPSLQRVHYPRLDECFLLDRVVTPALLGHLGSRFGGTAVQALATTTARHIMMLWPHYQKLLPEHVFTPRDLTDICSWINWYANQMDNMPSQEQMNALILQGFRDVLGHECDARARTSQQALEAWFSGQQPVDKSCLESFRQQTLAEAHWRFQNYARRIKPEFDTSPKAVLNLAHALEQDMCRCQAAAQKGQPHGGRQATLIEGPTGRGKDATLQLVIESFYHQQGSTISSDNVCFVSARDCPWDKLCQHIHKAQQEGYVLVISEMNLIPSQHLEGELNNILAGDAAPGFHLFATVNPPDYAGRQPLSQALLGRFRRIPIPSYSRDELAAIVSRVLPDTQGGKSIAERLADWHCRLRECLESRGIAMHPTSQELQKLADAIRDTDDEQSLRQHFEQHYRVYLLASGADLETLTETAPASVLKLDKTFDPELTHWVNQSIKKLDRPFCVHCEGTKGYINADHAVIHIPSGLDEPAAKKEIIRQLVLTRWKDSGMPLDGPETQDTLKFALYKFWQQSWFQKNWVDTLRSLGIELAAEDIFPMEEVHRLTLELPENRRYIEEVRLRFEEQPLVEAREWPALWQKLEEVPDVTVASYQRREILTTLPTPPNVNVVGKASSSGKETETWPSLIRLPEAISRPLRRNTGFSKRAAPKKSIPRIFYTDRDFRMFRLDVFHVQVSADGSITEKSSGRGKFGLEVVKPNSIIAGAPVFTGTNETYGINTIDEIAEDQYYYLSGLEPDDRLVALRTEPQLRYHIVRDRYTGLHMISFSDSEEPDRGKIQSVKVHYILKTKPPAFPRNMPAKTRHYKSIQSATREDAICPGSANRVIRNLLQTDSLNKLSQPVRNGLQAINQAVDDVQRVAAITSFCSGFQGNTDPAGDENFLEFLLTHRQGACRHRSNTFVLLCHYYGIPARLVKGQAHVFPEYSLDEGHSWQAVDLGGGLARIRVISSDDFPPRQKGSHLTSKMASLLQTIDEPQLALLGSAAGLTIEELRNMSSTGVMKASAKLTNLHFMVSNLLEQEVPGSFALAVDLLETIDDGGNSAMMLLGQYNRKYEITKLARAATHSMTFSDEEGSGEKSWTPVIKLMERLHEKVRSMGMKSEWGMVVRVWLKELVMAKDYGKIDEECYFAVFQIVLEKNWLLNFSDHLSANEILYFLHDIKQYERLAPLVTQHLLAWYQKVFVPDLSEDHRVKPVLKGPLSVEMQSNHSGCCPSLEAEIRTTGVGQRWSDEPENVPDIERLLSGQQAFPVSASENNELRPVIWQVTSNCLPEVFQRVVGALCRRYSQESEDDKAAIKKRFKGETRYDNRFYHSDIEGVCYQAVLTAFSHCLYKTICKEGGALTLAWNKVRNSRSTDYDSSYVSGSFQVESSTHLGRLVNGLATDLAYPEDRPFIRQAFNMPDALVIMPEDITRYAHEFVETLDVESLYRELIGQMLDDGE